MRYSVLTYIFGGYESVHEVLEKDKDAEYILVTDDETLKSDTWNIIVDKMDGKSIMEKCYYVRFHPFVYVHTDMVVRLDSSIGINKPLGVFINKMEDGNYDRCLMIHPRRNTLTDEYHQWVRSRGYSQEQADYCLHILTQEFYYDLSYKGLFQGCFEIVKYNYINREINHLTYMYLHDVALNGDIDRIDQTILTFVINYYFTGFLGTIKVLPVPQDVITDGRYMQWYYHGTNNPIKQFPSIEPMMFNKPCKVWMPT